MAVSVSAGSRCVSLFVVYFFHFPFHASSTISYLYHILDTFWDGGRGQFLKRACVGRKEPILGREDPKRRFFCWT